MNRLTTVLALAQALAVASTLTAQTAQRAPAKPPRQIVDTYGTTTESYYRMGASQFSPVSSGTQYTDRYIVDLQNTFGRYSTGGSPNFVGTPNMPSGALLTYLELDSCDFNASGAHLFVALWDCDYSGNCGGGPVKTLSSANNIVPQACSYVAADISDLGVTVNNYGRQITATVATIANDESNTFSGVILGYRLQVAPAPATATFGDVPTNHPYFQFIEALSNWGITAGCSTNPPDYCPDRAITRGEMAVYLAKALGLYLPQY